MHLILKMLIVELGLYDLILVDIVPSLEKLCAKHNYVDLSKNVGIEVGLPPKS